jgi:predicted TIM-barrel fold metal-dependent hydrolase
MSGRPRARLVFALLAAVTATAAVSVLARGRTPRLVAAPPRRPRPPRLHLSRFDLLATAVRLKSEGGPIAAVHIARVATLEAAQFAASGNIYRHYPTPELEPSCLERASCANDERDKQWNALVEDLGAVRSDAGELLAPASDCAHDIEAAERETVARVTALSGLAWRGGAEAPKRIWALASGHPADRLRDAALAQLVQQFADVRVATVDRASGAFALLGDRLTAAIIFDGHVIKDVTRYDQLVELVERGAPLPAVTRAPALPLIDAHLHLMRDGADKLMRILDANHVEAAVVTALPDDMHYAGLRQANQRVLDTARAHPGRLIPFVMISPLDADPRGELERYRAQGARGVKLISGHGSYFRAADNQPLDIYKMRALFRYCEEEAVPVLWHVNSDIYGQGFLRVLHDFPDLVVVNPHLGGYLGDAPELVRQLLEKYPNLSLDMSFGDQAMYVRRSLEELSIRHDAWRQLILDHPDRFLFGTDLVVTGGSSLAHANAVYELLTQMVAADHFDFHYSPPNGYASAAAESHHRTGLTGLALPPPVLRQILRDNAARLYGGATARAAR